MFLAGIHIYVKVLSVFNSIYLLALFLLNVWNKGKGLYICISFLPLTSGHWKKAPLFKLKVQFIPVYRLIGLFCE